MIVEKKAEENNMGEEAQALYDEFLDTRFVRQKREVLQKMWRNGYITDRMIDDFAVTLDIVIPSGETEARYYDLLRCLDSMARFETTGLR